MNWDTFTLGIIVEASPEAVFDAWTIPDRVCEWFVVKCPSWGVDGAPMEGSERLVVGGKMRLTWMEGTTDEVAIFEVKPNSHLAHGWFGGDGRIDVRVSVLEDGRTRCDLTQVMAVGDEDARRECWIGCNTGWTFYLANLKAWLEHRVDLRELKSPMTKGVVNI